MSCLALGHKDSKRHPILDQVTSLLTKPSNARNNALTSPTKGGFYYVPKQRQKRARHRQELAAWPATPLLKSSQCRLVLIISKLNTKLRAKRHRNRFLTSICDLIARHALSTSLPIPTSRPPSSTASLRQHHHPLHRATPTLRIIVSTANIPLLLVRLATVRQCMATSEPRAMSGQERISSRLGKT